MMFYNFFVNSRECYALTKVLHAFHKILIFVEVFTINRNVHTRALEGDGEKPLRHEHLGCLLIRFFYCWFMMDVSEMQGSQTS